MTVWTEEEILATITTRAAAGHYYDQPEEGTEKVYQALLAQWGGGKDSVLTYIKTRLHQLAEASDEVSLARTWDAKQAAEKVFGTKQHFEARHLEAVYEWLTGETLNLIATEFWARQRNRFSRGDFRLQNQPMETEAQYQERVEHHRAKFLAGQAS